MMSAGSQRTYSKVITVVVVAVLMLYLVNHNAAFVNDLRPPIPSYGICVVLLAQNRHHSERFFSLTFVVADHSDVSKVIIGGDNLVHLRR